MILHLDISDPQAEARLTAAALRQGVDVSAVIERLATEHLPPVEQTSQPEEPTLLDRFGHLFGTAQAGPGDRAAHPERYMEGFGQPKNPRPLEP